jgi:hypothetical protein
MLDTIDIYSSYLVSLFQSKTSVSTGGNASPARTPPGISLGIMAEFEQAATQLSLAYRTPGTFIIMLALTIDIHLQPVALPWSVEDYLRHLPPKPSGFNGFVEDSLESMFPPLNTYPFPIICDPICLVDNHGVILSWYLPRCLSPERQV